MAQKTKNETPEEKQYRETVEKIAGNIQKLVKAVTALIDGPLNRDALLLLIAAGAGQSKGVVNDVLKSIENMEKDWLNTPKK